MEHHWSKRLAPSAGSLLANRFTVTVQRVLQDESGTNRDHPPHRTHSRQLPWRGWPFFGFSPNAKRSHSATEPARVTLGRSKDNSDPDLLNVSTPLKLAGIYQERNRLENTFIDAVRRIESGGGIHTAPQSDYSSQPDLLHYVGSIVGEIATTLWDKIFLLVKAAPARKPARSRGTPLIHQRDARLACRCIWGRGILFCDLERAICYLRCWLLAKRFLAALCRVSFENGAYSISPQTYPLHSYGRELFPQQQACF